MNELTIRGAKARQNLQKWSQRVAECRISGDTDRPIVLYEYQPGRGTCHPKKFLDGFKGYLHTDGYKVYRNLSDEITVVGCWAHARRKFDEAMKSLPKGKAKNSSAAQGKAYCDLLFKIEGGLADLSPKERYDRRLKRIWVNQTLYDLSCHGARRIFAAYVPIHNIFARCQIVS